MIKPRLHDLALGGVWQPCSTELASIHTTNHVGHEKRVVLFTFSMHACSCFYSYGALTADRALLENNNILTWLQGFQVKIEIFLKFLLSLNQYIKLMLIELVIKLETKSFEMKCPLMGAGKSSVELQVNAFFFCHINLLITFQS